MKDKLNRLISKIIIWYIKKCSYTNETFLRLLIHHLLKKMNDEQKGEIDLEYSHESTKTKLIVLAYLTDKD